MADQIAGYIKEAGVEVAVFPGAQPNPTDKNLHDGLKALGEMTRFCIITNTDTHVKMAIVDLLLKM